jgi:hypothetical protein
VFLQFTVVMRALLSEFLDRFPVVRRMVRHRILDIGWVRVHSESEGEGGEGDGDGDWICVVCGILRYSCDASRADRMGAEGRPAVGLVEGLGRWWCCGSIGFSAAMMGIYSSTRVRRIVDEVDALRVSKSLSVLKTNIHLEYLILSVLVMDP